jgi:uncharacterized protein YheU (UPF0270 family)
MKKKIRINPITCLGYIPKDLVDNGYTGDVDILINAVTATLIKPGTDLQSVKRSLEITIQDIDLRIQQGDV